MSKIYNLIEIENRKSDAFKAEHLLESVKQEEVGLRCETEYWQHLILHRTHSQGSRRNRILGSGLLQVNGLTLPKPAQIELLLSQPTLPVLLT